MTALAGKDTLQQESSIEVPMDVDLLEKIRQLMMESEQRISSQLLQLGAKIDNLQQQISGINKQMAELKKETNQLQKEVKAVDADTKLLKSVHQDLLTSHLRLLYERSLYRLRIQNFHESDEEQIEDKIIKWLGEIAQISEQTLQRVIDVIFRVQSRQAKKAGTAREVMVTFFNRSIRDKIFESMAYKDQFIVEQRILILKDIPYEIRQRWLAYKGLTTLLRGHQIKYRWLVPEGLSFIYKKKPHTIKSSEELNQFRMDYAEMSGRSTGQDSKKTKISKKP